MAIVFSESYIIGFKEGFKIGIVWLILYSFLVSREKNNLIRPFFTGLAFSLAVAGTAFFLPTDLIPHVILRNVISASFAIFLIASAAALLHASGTNLFGKGQWADNKVVLKIMIIVTAFLFFAPDITGTLLFLKELSSMQDMDVLTYGKALIGCIIAVTIFAIIVTSYRPYWLGRFFDIPQLLLFLAIVKLMGSGIQGFAELSLIPAVQRGFMKFSHDFVHQTLVMVMVPDHPLLRATTWNFIGIFFGTNIASFASLLIMLFSPLLFLYFSLFRPLPEPESKKRAEKRKIKALILSSRRKKALPVLVFIILISVSWFIKRGESISDLFVPETRPVVAEHGVIRIPLSEPAANLMDGALHRFTYTHEKDEIGILIIKKPDETLSVCLDACEICPPVGYGQRIDHVVCIYCRTPISLDTLGQPGGCNPIPLSAEVDERFVTISTDEILDKWGFVLSGESKEPGRTDER